MSPGWCSSVDWVWACQPKGRWFDSQSEHKPGLWTRFPLGGAWEATTQWCFPLFLPPFPSNKILEKKIKRPDHECKSLQNGLNSPGWVARLVGASPHTPKGFVFDFWLEHKPRLLVWYPQVRIFLKKDILKMVSINVLFFIFFKRRELLDLF